MKKLSNYVESVCRLTPLQEGMLFYNLYTSKGAYIIQNVMELTGYIDKGQLVKTFNILSKIHEILRGIIVNDSVKNPLLVFLNEYTPEVTFFYYDSPAEFNDFLEADKQRGFELNKDALFRVALFEKSDNHYYMVMTYSHIIIDGWSYSILMNDFSAIYMRLSQGIHEEQIINDIVNARDILKFSQYSNWIRGKDLRVALEYWDNYLDGYANFSGIISLKKNGKIVKDTYKTVNIEISKDITNQMYDFCQKYKITPNTVMETVWGLTLQEYNNVQDVLFGKVVVGRNNTLSGIMEMVGTCINTIPSRVTSKENESIIDLMKRQHQTNLESMEYDYCSLPDLLSHAGKSSEIIQTIFIFENLHEQERLCIDDSILQIRDIDVVHETNYDISIYAEVDDKIYLVNKYNEKKYNSSQMNLLMQRYRSFLEQIMDNPRINVCDLNIWLEQDEKDLIHRKFNAPYDEEVFVPLQTMFMKSVLNNINDTALIFNDNKMTYAELDCLSTKIAKNLISIGIKKGEFVALVAQRGVELFAAIYGIIKAGAVYIPIDYEYPEERISYILEDSDCQYVLVTDYIKLNTNKKQILVKELYSEQKDIILNIDYELSDNVYLIYTSGTTGKPNGVMVSNKNIVNYCSQHLNNIYGGIIQKDNKVIACITTISFDIFVTEIFMSLLNGMEVIVASELAQNDGGMLCDLIERYKVDSLQITPSRMKFIMQSDRSHKLKNLKTIFIGGEVLTWDLCKKIREKTEADLYNVYGPSETTVWSTIEKVDKTQDFENIPIGRPIRNTKIYIRSRNHKLCGIGMIGEICIQGYGVSNGYLNNKKLNDEKFYFNEWDMEKTYCTGDLGYWLEDGRIQYVGRMDEQVKIRGIRVEIKEIEKLILENCPSVQNIKVVVRKKEQQEYLCAYYVSEHEIDVATLRGNMSKKIHQGVFPIFFRIDRLPTNLNGKFDQSLLPELKFNTLEFKEPSNDVEETLIQMLKEILGVQEIGINDDFFALGGHSLNAMSLINMLQIKYGIRMTIKDLFCNSSIKRFAEIVSSKIDLGKENSINEFEIRNQGGVTKLQEGIYIAYMMNENGIDYNMPQCYCVNGKINMDKLRKAFRKLVEKHEILRTNYILQEEGVSVLQREVFIPMVEYKQCKNLEEEYHEFVRPFDLENDSLIRMKVVKTNEKQYLLVDAHHIILDGISLGLVLEKLSKYYIESDKDEDIVQFREYCTWINTQNLVKQERFWIQNLKGNISPLTLNGSKSRPAERSIEGDIVSMAFSARELNGICDFLNRNKITEYMLFLS